MKRSSLLLTASGLLMLAASFASAYVLIDPPVRWDDQDLPRNIEINQNGHSAVDDADGGVTEIVDAINDSWTQVVPGLTTTSVSSSPPISIGDGISTMHFNVAGTGCSGGCLAVTMTPIPPASPTVTVNSTDFRPMTDSDIFFNPSAKFYSDSEADGCRREYHIESVAVHEVGHLLGLGHSLSTNATMYAYANRCDSGPETLDGDDQDGILCIYQDGAGCGACVPNTLTVDVTECEIPTRGRNKNDFVVSTWVVDNCGGAVSGATVTISVDSPAGPLSCSGDTNSSGRLSCALDNPPSGPYTSTVSNVTKAGYSWPGTECGDAAAPCECSVTAP
jgi:hypothetical protein